MQTRKNKRSRENSLSEVDIVSADPMDEFRKSIEKRPTICLGDLKAIFIDLSKSIQDLIHTSDNTSAVAALTKKVDNIADSLSGVSDAAKKMAELVDKLNDTIESNQEIKNENMKLRERVLELEINNVRGNLILKNLPMCESAITSNRMENATEASDTLYSKFLQPLGLAEQITKFSAHRMPLQRGIPMMKIQLEYPTQKSLIFRALGAKGKNLENRIVLKNEYPKVLMGELKEAEKKAYEIRQSSKGEIRTRVTLRNGVFVVLQKRKNDLKYQ